MITLLEEETKAEFKTNSTIYSRMRSYGKTQQQSDLKVKFRQSRSIFINPIIIIVAFFIITRNDYLFANSASVGALHGKIPQHRVRASKRVIEYNRNHPWIRNTHKRRNRIKDSTSSDTGSVHVQSEAYRNDDPNWWTESDIQSDDNEDTYQPIRIRAVLVPHPSSGYNYVTLNQREVVLATVKPILNNWSRALLVPRIQTNLTIDRDQLFDRVSCGPGVDSGLPSVVVPEEHIVHGESGVDLIVYISLGFEADFEFKVPEHNFNKESVHSPTSPNSPTKRTSSFEHDLDTYKWVDFDENEESSSPFFEENHLQENAVDNAASNAENNVVDPATSAPAESIESPPNESPPKYCTGTYLASATYCSTDQYDRPVAGLMHLCIGRDFFKTESHDINHKTIMHEMGHILGFNSNSLAHFRDRRTGSPLTKRVEDDVPDVEIECTGIDNGRRNDTIPLPSEKILQFRKVRGALIAQIVTPTVRQIARNRFDCQDLEGAELETEIFHPGDTLMNPSCIGDHWERRLFKNDIMNPIIDPTLPSTLISPLTLAYFIDSGWYKVDPSRAYAGDTWGRGAGCQFVNDPCVSGGRVAIANEKFFCSRHEGQNDGCTADLLSKAACPMTEYSSSLPVEYQYFPLTNVGGFDAHLDYCPVFTATSEHGMCKDKPDNSVPKFALESYGLSDSRCISGSIRGQVVPLCMQVACATETKTLHINVDGYWKQCDYSGEIKDSWWGDADYGK